MTMPSLSVILLLMISVVVLLCLKSSDAVSTKQVSAMDSNMMNDKNEIATEEVFDLSDTAHIFLDESPEAAYTMPKYDIKFERLYEQNVDATALVMEDMSTIMFKTKDERVTILQERLIELSYLHIDESTTYYGPATRAACSSFQKQHDLKVTGNANSRTLKLMFSANAKKCKLCKGDEGDDVMKLQDLLYDLAYIDKRTGYYGEQTVEAIKSFQKKNELDETGIADSATIELLYNPEAKPSDTFGSKEQRRAKINQFVDLVYAQLGKRYSLGSTGPNSFDCSGLVYYCLRQAGSSRRRLTAAGYSQVSEWERISSMSNLEIGDLLFFYSSSSHSRIGHVGVYVGGGMMIDASTSSGRIIKQSCRASYWLRLYAFARRPW